MMQRTRVGVFGLLLVLAAACSDTSATLTSCGVMGAVEECVCLDDRPGVHRCDESGTWDACDCAPTDSSDASDSSDSAGSSGSSDSAGSSGSPSASDPITTCQNSLDCVDAALDSMVCDADRGQCVECVADADCDSDLVCSQNVCRAPCDSNFDCTPLNPVCDLESGRCEQSGSRVDAGGVDAGRVDGGGVDAGGVDAGGTDAGGVGPIEDGAEGYPCDRNSDCASGLRCGVDICVDGSLGDQCSSGLDCDAAGGCFDNLCTSGVEGDSCDNGFDCADGLRCGVDLCVDGSPGDQCSSGLDCDNDCQDNQCT